jgi:hypothetical protein
MGTVPKPALQQRLDRSEMARSQIRNFKVMHLDYCPRESHLITFKDPYSFPLLFHPDCNDLVVQHMNEIAEKVGFYVLYHNLALSDYRYLARWGLCCSGRISNNTLLPTK